MIPLVSSQELISYRHNQDFVLVDARTGTGANDDYFAQHLAGALYVDLEQDLSAKNDNPSKGGRHPLPDLRSFCQFLGNLGIQTSSHIVVYDDKSGANSAARFWWMLKSIGHQKVQVLDGGYKSALIANYPLSSGQETALKIQEYKANTHDWKVATISEVEKAAQDLTFLVIDVREAPRYQGETEPIDLIAGHIPGAINIPFTTNLDYNGLYLPKEQLISKYKQAIGNRKTDNVIVHCGSGITACHTLLAMAHAEIEGPKLYVGSWSEWSRSGRPMATGN